MKYKKLLLPIVGIIFLIVGLWVAFLLSQQQQNIREKAAVPGGVGTITLSPLTVTKYIGDTFSTTVKFNTKGMAIGSLTFRLTYNYTGTTPELEVVDANGLPASQISADPALLSTGNWYFIRNVTRTNGKVVIEFAAVNTTTAGYATNTDTNLATINFKVARATTSPVNLTFDLADTQMLTKSGPATSPSTGPYDILAVPTNATYTISADTTAPAAITTLGLTNPTTTSMNLSWVAPSDSGPLGRASSYDIRYSTSLINATSFATATQVTAEPVPTASGTNQNMTVSGLSSNSTYFFAMKSTDAAGNISNISNVASLATVNPCTRNNPTVSVNPTTQTGRTGLALSYTISLKNNNVGTCASESYFTSLLPANITGSWTISLLNPTNIIVATGATGTFTLSVRPDSGIINGSYNIPVSITNSADNTQVGTVSPIYVVSNVVYNYKFRLQGISNSGVSANQLSVDSKNLSTTSMSGFADNVVSGTNGVFSETIERNNLTAGLYDVSIKVPNYLRKALRNVNIIYGTNSLDFTATPFIVGDFDNNNILNITDISQILSIYTQLSIPITTANQKYDVNADNTINISDIAIILSNYTVLSLPGDNY